MPSFFFSLQLRGHGVLSFSPLPRFFPSIFKREVGAALPKLAGGRSFSDLPLVIHSTAYSIDRERKLLEGKFSNPLNSKSLPSGDNEDGLTFRPSGRGG